ncbi:MAG TPA: PfkB family carbohydrate kinase [Solirubrobacteraceae bacterium]|nr:PfkB family carbohydrate kinase [Solirubrobacteraceae bacterium]
MTAGPQSLGPHSAAARPGAHGDTRGEVAGTDRLAPELLTVGRISVDLYCPDPGRGWREATRFERAVGGSPTNVAIAAARLGRRAALYTKVGDDPFGEMALAELLDYGVDVRWVGVEPGLRTPLAFAALDPPEDPRLHFRREEPVPDVRLRPGEVPGELARDLPLLWVAGGALAADPSRHTVLELLSARGARDHTVLDLDWRPSMWESAQQARGWLRRALGMCTVAVGNRSECAIAVGDAEPHVQAQRLLELGVRLAVVKLGADGALWAQAVEGAGRRSPAGGAGRTRRSPMADGEGEQRSPGASESGMEPAPSVQVVCGLGAGDGFGGALCHALLAGWPTARAVRFAAAAGAIVASRLVCSAAMPTHEEVLDLMETAGVAR